MSECGIHVMMKSTFFFFFLGGGVARLAVSPKVLSQVQIQQKLTTWLLF